MSNWTGGRVVLGAVVLTLSLKASGAGLAAVPGCLPENVRLPVYGWLAA